MKTRRKASIISVVIALALPANVAADSPQVDERIAVLDTGALVWARSWGVVHDGESAAVTIYKEGSFDQREIEVRSDVLVYSTAPLKEGVEISGAVEITLYVSSDAKDTDFTVKLVDVYPDGKAYNLDETIQRVRYREGDDKEVFMGGNNYDEAVGVVAHNKVHHSAAYPSQIRVAVVKR